MASAKYIRKTIHIIVWALLITLGGRITIPIPVIPITLQTLFVVLAGLIDGAAIGALSAGLYLIIGLCGAPVFAGGMGGLAILSRASVGFALAFPIGGALAGLLARPHNGRYRLLSGLTAAVAAHGVILVSGYFGMTVVGSLPSEKAVSSIVSLLPGALVKSVLACLMAGALLKYVDLLGKRDGA